MRSDLHRRKRSLAKFKCILQQRTWRSQPVDVREANKADGQRVLAVAGVAIRSQRAGCATRSVATVARLVIWEGCLQAAWGGWWQRKSAEKQWQRKQPEHGHVLLLWQARSPNARLSSSQWKLQRVWEEESHELGVQVSFFWWRMRLTVRGALDLQQRQGKIAQH